MSSSQEQHGEQVARALRRNLASIINDFGRAINELDRLIEVGQADHAAANSQWWSDTLSHVSAELAGCAELSKSFAAITTTEKTADVEHH